MQKQVLTGNQMDVQRRDQESKAGSVVHSAEEVQLRYQSCFPQVIASHLETDGYWYKTDFRWPLVFADT